MKVPKKLQTFANNQTGLLERFSLYFFDHVKVSVAVWIAILLGGLLSYATLLKREGFPPIQVPIAIVEGTYFVDDKVQVDDAISRPVAAALQDIPEIESARTTAAPNFFTAVVFFDESVEAEEGARRIDSAINQNVSLPDGVDLQVRTVNPAGFLNEYDVLVSVYGENGLSLSELQTQTRVIAERFGQLDGIADSSVQEQIVEVENPATGEVTERQTSFGNIGLKNDDGVLIFYDSVTIGISKTEDIDAIELSERISNEANSISNTNDSVQVAISSDFADSITTQIDSLQMNLLGGLLAVALVSLLLITWRASIITALFMLSVVLLTLLALWILGYTLNTITLFGLVLALGLFVDDATIVVEAIDANRKKKKSARAVVGVAVRRVASASFAGTMTTVLVFLPLAFVGGILGEFIRLLPITVMVALVSSLVLSLSVIPFLAQFVLLRSDKNQRVGYIRRAIAYLAGRAEAGVLLLKDKKTRKKGRALGYGAVLVSLVLVGLSVFYAGKLQFNIFPPSSDSDRIGIQLTFQPGTTIQDAQVIARDANTAVDRLAGDQILRISYGAFSLPNERGADAQIDLIPFTDRSVTSRQIIDQLETGLDAAVGERVTSIRVQQFDAGPPVEEFPFKAQIFSEDQAQAVRLADEMSDVLLAESVVRPNGESAQVTDTQTENTQTIVRTKGERYVELQAAFDAEDTSALVGAAQSKLEDRFTQSYLDDNGYEPVRIGYDFGQESDNADSFNSLGIVFPIALGLMFLLLAVQFRSLLQPLLIFLAIPFSLFGVFYGLYLANTPMSFFVMVGLIGLIGIAVNNSIMLTDYANQERRAGADPVDAIATATRLRFRPLLATTLTTIVALLPLAMTDPFWESLSLTIIFGLVSSTLLIIVAFPYYYLASEWLRTKVKRPRKK